MAKLTYKLTFWNVLKNQNFLQNTGNAFYFRIFGFGLCILNINNSCNKHIEDIKKFDNQIKQPNFIFLNLMIRILLPYYLLKD